mmetsp:Transcript_24960/g.58914  ORF Transcript_24960/g.58914 Transcript_24960/m.58914 type:complete len:319 (+) Transcript_24960:345-1301(+)
MGDGCFRTDRQGSPRETNRSGFGRQRKEPDRCRTSGEYHVNRQDGLHAWNHRLFSFASKGLGRNLEGSRTLPARPGRRRHRRGQLSGKGRRNSARDRRSLPGDPPRELGRDLSRSPGLRPPGRQARPQPDRRLFCRGRPPTPTDAGGSPALSFPEASARCPRVSALQEGGRQATGGMLEGLGARRRGGLGDARSDRRVRAPHAGAPKQHRIPVHHRGRHRGYRNETAQAGSGRLHRPGVRVDLQRSGPVPRSGSADHGPIRCLHCGWLFVCSAGVRPVPLDHGPPHDRLCDFVCSDQGHDTATREVTKREDIHRFSRY